MDQAVSIGRIVLFGLGTRDGKVVERPAIVVHVWDNNGVQLQVFTDANNDEPYLQPDERTTREVGSNKQARSVVWRTSIRPADDHAVAQELRWRWPPRV